MSSKKDLLHQLENDLQSLDSTELIQFRLKENNFPVFGKGSVSAKLFFIGEAPGRNEAKTGVPFCGAAGKVLDDLLESISLKREDVYITNIVKDRPPNNRDPYTEEINHYAPFLNKEIEIVKPEVLVTLGRYAMDYIMRKYNLEDELEPISVAHGKVYESKEVKIIPLYHPAAAIYNRQLIEVSKKDIQILKRYIK